MSRASILIDLVNQLDGLDRVEKATMRLLLFEDQQNNMPYIGVIPSEGIPTISDGYDTRYTLTIVLNVKTREDRTPIETLIADIETLIRSIDLGSDVYSCKVAGIQEVDINDVKATRYSEVGILLELIYVENHGTTYPAIESRTLTQPTGYTHYKIKETLVSGSTTIQPLGTNVYDSHFRADMEIPPGSGSISIGTISNEMNEDDGAVYDDELIENHMITVNIRVNSAYIGEYGVVPQPFIDRSMIDNITGLLWGKTSSVLGNYYRVHEINNVVYNQTFERTLGASMDVVVEIVQEYT